MFKLSLKTVVMLIGFMSFIAACSPSGGGNSSSDSAAAPINGDASNPSFATQAIPTVSFVINGGADYTNSTTATLTLTVTDAPNKMYITNVADCLSGGSWRNIASSTNWTLPNANGSNTIYMKVRNSFSSISDCVSQTIIHDNTAPVASSILIDGGASYTNTLDVTVALAATGNPTDMYVTQTAGCAAGGTWEPYSNSKNWTLATPNASNTIYYRVRDAASNLSTCISDTIIHDPNASTLAINNSDAYTNSTAVNLSIFGSGSPTEMYITNTAGCGSGGSWATYVTADTWTLASPNATNTVYIKFRDASLVESACIGDTIIHDGVAPTATSISIDGGAAVTNVAGINLTLAGGGTPTSMYITQTAGCLADGAWVPYNTSLPWTLISENATNTVYFKVRDIALNESACISDTIVHDNTPPNPVSISINAGADYTNSTAATVTLSAGDSPTQMYITNTAGCNAGGTWAAYSTSAARTLPSTNNTNTIYVAFRDAAGNESACINDTIIHDSAKPVASSLVINGGAAQTGSLLVNLTLTATGTPSEMYVTNTSGCGSGGTWEAFSINKDWTLATPNATNTVYFKVRDAAGNESTACRSDTIIHNPTAASISINSADAQTNSTSVTLDLQGSVNATEMYITNTGGCGSGGTWATYATSAPWTMTAGDGAKTVYIKYRDAGLVESTCINDTITLDTVVPTATSISINSAATYSTSTAVTLTLAGAGTPTEMYITQTAACASGGTWVPYLTSKAWTLTSPNATNTVYFKVRDSAGNESTCINDTIIHDNTPPAADLIAINNDDAFTTSTAGTLTIAASSAPNQMYVTNTASCAVGGVWEAYSTSKAWTLTANATNNVYVKFRDLALNESSCISDSIIHDTVAPTATSISINAGATYTNSTSVTLNVAGTGGPFEMYATETAGCSAGGSWTAYSTSMPFTISSLNATNTVYFKIRDGALNESTCINDTIIHDDIPPVAVSISINAGADYTQSTAASLALSSTGGVTEMYITATAGCSSGGTWESYATSKSYTLAANTVNTVYVKFRDVALAESSCISDSITHDTIAPTFAVTSPTEASYVGLSNQSSVTISGTCSEEGRNINITGDAVASPTCTSGVFSVNIDMSALGEGAVAFAANFSDAAGNAGTTINRNLVKDITPPTATSISINSAAAYTNNLAVNLDIVASNGQNQMYVTQTAGCGSGGVWEAYNTTKAWNLTTSNAVNTVYIKFRDLALNESSCINDTIEHEQDPTLSFTTPAGNFINSSNFSSFAIGGACAPNGLTVNISGGISTTATCSAGAWSTTVDFSLFVDGDISINADMTNNHAVAATQASRTLTLDREAPTPVSITFWATKDINGVLYSNTTLVDVGPYAVGSSNMYVTNDPACLVGGSWEAYNNHKAWTLQNLNVVNSIYAKFRDAAGNISACVSGSILHDNLGPTIFTVSNPATIYVNSTNQSAIVFNGTCSDQMEKIVFSDMFSILSPCLSGAWSRTINMSGFASGTYNLNFDFTDIHKNPATRITRTIIKDVGLPTITWTNAFNSYISPDNIANFNLSGTCSEEGQTITFSNGVTGVTTCSSGVWSHNVDLTGAAEGVLRIHAVHRDVAGNNSLLAIQQFRVDTVAPTIEVTSPDAGSTISPANVSSYLVSGTCSDIATYVYITGHATASPICNSNVWSAYLDFSGAPEGTVSITVTTTDRAGNSANTNRSFIKATADIVAPDVAITTPVNAEKISELDLKLIGTCEEPLAVNVSYSGGITGPTSVSCVAGKYEFFYSLSGSGGARYIETSQTDGNGNIGTARVDFTFVKTPEIKGQVLAVVKASNGSIFYGGNFTSYTGTRLGRAMLVNSSGVKDLTFDLKSGFNGNVYAVAELSDGSLLFGGDFTKFRNRIANRIAKIDSNGNLDLTFNPQTGFNGASSVVKSIVVSGSNIYVGGLFITMKGAPANRIAKINSDGDVDTTFNPAVGTNGASGGVNAIAIDGSDIFIGGDFLLYRGSTAVRVAKVDGTSGALISAFSSAGVEKSVFALLVDGSNLFIGGSFATYAGAAAKSIAKVDTTFGNLDATFNPASGDNGFTSIQPAVKGLAMLGTDIVVAGNFQSYRNFPANNIAKISTAGVLDLTFNPATGANGFNEQVNAVIQVGSDIYVGGHFTQYRNSQARGLAKLDASGVLNTTFNPSSGVSSTGTDGAVNAVVSTAAGIYVGGSFTSYRDSNLASNILKTDASGNIDATFNPQASANGFNDVVRAIAIDGTDIYVGGDFTTYRGAAANYIAKLNMSGVLDTTFNPSSGNNGTDALVRSVAVSGTSVYVAGDFMKYREGRAFRIAKIDTATGDIDTTFNPTSGYNGTNQFINSIGISGSNLYLAGGFTSYRGQPALRLAKVDAMTGVLDTVFSPAPGANGTNSIVNTLIISGGDIYIGGLFTTYRGAGAVRLAKLNATTGVLDGTFVGNLNAGVNAMTMGGGSLFVTGDFTAQGAVIANRVAKLNASTGAVDTTFSPSISALNGIGGSTPLAVTVYPAGTSLRYDSGNLFIGGGFTLYRNKPYNFHVTVDSNGAPL